jgi:16S rRNA (guanine(1405)-N(7))-methyltransferase
MSEAGAWLDGERVRAAMERLIEAEAAAIVAKYRTSAPQASAIVRSVFAGDKKLQAAAQKAAAEGSDATWSAALQRTRAYRDAVTAARGEVYQSLRRYRADDGQQDALIAQLAAIEPADADARDSLTWQIAELHASTHERVPDEAEFYDRLLREIGAAETIVDVGCGVQPLRFPFARIAALHTYVAIDSNRRSIEAVAALARCVAPCRLSAVHDDLSGGWSEILHAAGTTRFDVALLLKLAPVVARQDRELLPTLAQTPARRWIVTGSRISLAKRQSIERRERGVVERFLRDAGKSIRSDFAIGEEFGYVAE